MLCAPEEIGKQIRVLQLASMAIEQKLNDHQDW